MGNSKITCDGIPHVWVIHVKMIKEKACRGGPWRCQCRWNDEQKRSWHLMNSMCCCPSQHATFTLQHVPVQGEHWNVCIWLWVKWHTICTKLAYSWNVGLFGIVPRLSDFAGILKNRGYVTCTILGNDMIACEFPFKKESYPSLIIHNIQYLLLLASSNQFRVSNPDSNEGSEIQIDETFNDTVDTSSCV